ncbi:MAG: biotin/lipoyl-binding protein, partial [Candidatus Gastranaerophilaceae bacterium]
MKIKLKTAGFICFALFLAVGLIFYAVKRDGEKIIQGEVETQTFDLSSKVTGRVSEIKVKKGDKVNKGDVLIVLDTPEISAKS